MTDTPIVKQTLTEQLGLRVDATLDTQIMTARSFPRDLKQCMKNILDTATMDSEIAESCYYSVPRAGKFITGPSIRLAEVCASFWGNMRVGSKVISNDGKSVVVEGFCWDLERNLMFSSEVSRSIRDKYGKTYTPDMQSVTTAAASAIAMRNCIFKIVPQVFIERAYKKAMEFVVNPTARNEKFDEQRLKIFNRFNALGIENKTILDFFKKTTLEDIDQEELAQIIGVGTSIKEGMLKAEEAFRSNESEGEVVSFTQQPTTKADELLAALGGK